MKKTGSFQTSEMLVAVRVRPLNEFEQQVPNCYEALSTSKEFVVVENPDSDVLYAFDTVFGTEENNHDVYERVADPIVQSCVSGVNGAIMAYGQTASGKTYCMQGNEEDPGLIDLCARKIFEKVAGGNYTVTVTYLEIYKEKIRDLLYDDNYDLRIREDPQYGFHVEGLQEVQVTNHEDVWEMFLEGQTRRHIAGTDMNEVSSRSHTIFTINLLGRESESNPLVRSRLSLVDLAGSENIRSTNAEGERLKEGGQINKSLLALSMVISSLANKDVHIRFRDSKLTQILQPCLSGNCRSAIICCVTPASMYVPDSTATLKFATSARKIQTKYSINEVMETIRASKRSPSGGEESGMSLMDELRMQNQITRIERAFAEELQRMVHESAANNDRLQQLEQGMDALIVDFQSKSTYAAELESHVTTAREATETELARLRAEAEAKVSLEREAEAKDAIIHQLQQALEQKSQAFNELSESFKDKESAMERTMQEKELAMAEINRQYTQLCTEGAKQSENLLKVEKELAMVSNKLAERSQEAASLKTACEEATAMLTLKQNELGAIFEEREKLHGELVIKMRELTEAQSDASRFGEELTGLRSECETLKEKESLFLRSISTVEAEREALRLDVQSANQLYAKLEQSHAEAVQKVAQLESANQNLVKSDTAKENLIASVNAELSQAQEKLKKLSEKERTLSEAVESQAKEIARLHQEELAKQALQRQIQEMEKDLAELKAAMEDGESEKEGVLRTQEAREQEWDDLRKSMESELSKRQMTIEKQEQDLIEFHKTFEALRQTREEFAHFALEHDRLATKHAEIAIELKSTHEELNRLKQGEEVRLGEIRSELAIAQAEAARLVEDLSKAQSTQHDVEAQVTELQHENTLLAAQVKETVSKFSEASSELEMATARIRTLESLKAELTEKTSLLNESEAKRDALEESVQTLTSQVRSTAETLEERSAIVARLEEECRVQASCARELEKQLSDAKNELNARTEMSKDEVELKSNELEDATRRLEELHQEVQAATEALAAAKKREEDLQAAIQAAAQHVNEKERTHEEMQLLAKAANEQLESMAIRAREAEHELNELRNQLAAAKEDVALIKSHAEEEKVKYLAEMRQFAEAKEAELEAALQAAQEEMALGKSQALENETALKESLTSLEKELQARQGSLMAEKEQKEQELQAIKGSFAKELERLKESKALLLVELDRAKESQATLSDELERVRTERDAIAEKLTAVQSTEVALQQDLDRVITERDVALKDFQAQVAAFEDQMKLERDEAAILDARLKELNELHDAKILLLEEDLAQARNQLNEATADMERWAETSAQLEGELEQIKLEAESTLEEKSAANAEVLRLTEELDRYREKADLALEENTSLHDELAKVTEDLAQTKIILESKVHEEKSVTSVKIARLTEELAQSKSDADEQIKALMEEQSRQLAELSRITHELKASELERESLMEIKMCLDADLAKVQEEIIRKKFSLAEAEAEIKTEKSKSVELSTAMLDAKKQVIAMEGEVKKAKGEAEIQAQTIQILLTEKEKKTDELCAMDEELTRVRDELRTSAEILAQKEEEIFKLREVLNIRAEAEEYARVANELRTRTSLASTKAKELSQEKVKIERVTNQLRFSKELELHGRGDGDNPDEEAEGKSEVTIRRHSSTPVRASRLDLDSVGEEGESSAVERRLSNRSFSSGGGELFVTMRRRTEIKEQETLTGQFVKEKVLHVPQLTMDQAPSSVSSPPRQDPQRQLLEEEDPRSRASIPPSSATMMITRNSEQTVDPPNEKQKMTLAEAMDQSHRLMLELIRAETALRRQQRLSISSTSPSRTSWIEMQVNRSLDAICEELEFALEHPQGPERRRRRATGLLAKNAFLSNLHVEELHGTVTKVTNRLNALQIVLSDSQKENIRLHHELAAAVDSQLLHELSSSASAQEAELRETVRKLRETYLMDIWSPPVRQGLRGEHAGDVDAKDELDVLRKRNNELQAILDGYLSTGQLVRKREWSRDGRPVVKYVPGLASPASPVKEPEG